MPKRPGHGTIFLLLSLAVLGTGRSLCQQTSTETSKPQARAARLLMWKATSPTTTVYLLPSVHVGDKAMYPLPKAIEDAFASSKALAVEINAKNLDPLKTMQMVQAHGTYDEKDGISRHLSKQTLEALDQFCQAHGLPRAALEELRPWVVATVVIATAYQQAGEDAKLGIDMHFLDEAKAQRIDELETADFQFSLFSSASDDEQQEMLADALKNSDKTKDMMKKIQNAYISGDSTSIQKLLEEENATGPKWMVKKLIDDRNVTMTERVERYLKGTETCFVVVGAAHIIGEKGMVRLLQDKGYKIEQVAAGSN